MGRYRRTISFPNPINLNPKPRSYHVRSVSLPCGRTHPLIPQLRDEVTELTDWVRSGGDLTRVGSVRVVSGLTRLKSVLDSLDDVLQLPQTQDALSTQTDVVERLLEDFLRFVDVYETFHGNMLGLKEELASAQVAVRRKDDSKLGPYVKAHKKIVGEVGKLINNAGLISDQSSVIKTHDEIARVIQDVHCLTASVSETVFSGVSGSFGPCRRPGWAGLGLRRVRKEQEGVEEFVKVLGGVEDLLESRKKNKSNSNNVCKDNEEVKMGVLKKMKEMEECVEEMERESERVFRSLISNRVSLLNILTHA